MTILIYLLFLPLAVVPAPRPAAGRLIVPGRSLGSIRLGVAAAASGLPTTPAAAGDAAMMKQWDTWYGARPADGSAPTELDVYRALRPGSDNGQKSVQAVRATSPWFHLANRLRVGARLREIRAAYGALPLAITYCLPGGRRYLYDDVARGVAFETDGTAAGSTCRAIVVHLPGRANTSTMSGYLTGLPRTPSK